jgi:hypothetical protein
LYETILENYPEAEKDSLINNYFDITDNSLYSSMEVVYKGNVMRAKFAVVKATLFSLACTLEDSLEVVKLLIKHGANVNSEVTVVSRGNPHLSELNISSTMNVLTFMIETCYLDIAELIIENEAFKVTYNNLYNSPLLISCSKPTTVLGTVVFSLLNMEPLDVNYSKFLLVKDLLKQKGAMIGNIFELYGKHIIDNYIVVKNLNDSWLQNILLDQAHDVYKKGLLENSLFNVFRSHNYDFLEGFISHNQKINLKHIFHKIKLTLEDYKHTKDYPLLRILFEKHSRFDSKDCAAIQLKEAIDSGNHGIIENLLAKSKTNKIKDSNEYKGSLAKAILKGDVNIIKLFMQYGEKPDDGNLKLAQICALKSGNKEIVELIKGSFEEAKVFHDAKHETLPILVEIDPIKLVGESEDT